jgi:exodeoxyribonuclease III
MAEFKIATYNVNSIRSRLHIVIPWLKSEKPDVLCMQETKTADDLFPAAAFAEAGYHVVFRGGKKGNGVAIASIAKPKEIQYGLDDDGPPDTDRLIAATFPGITLINVYVPQGFKMEAPQFAYKLEWFTRFEAYLSRHFSPKAPLILCGDLNVAREEIDVHNPKRILGHADFNPDVWQAFDRIKAWGFVDIFRKHHPGEPGQYTFFDYRIPGTVERGLGWRVDHILSTTPLAKKSLGCSIDMNPRLAEKPSDHTILYAEFTI